MPGQDSAAAPRDARAIAAILKDLGVEKYDASVVHMLLNAVHAHVGDLLQSALSVAEHAGHAEIELNDLQLASEAQRPHAEPLPRTAVLALARERNAVPLPLVPPCHPSSCETSIPLPVPAHRLRSQLGLNTELPQRERAMVQEKRSPWTITAEERLALEQQLPRGNIAGPAVVYASMATDSPPAAPSHPGLDDSSPAPRVSSAQSTPLPSNAGAEGLPPTSN
jgi:histone H3/H4